MKGGQYTKREGGMWSFCCVGYRVAPSSDPASPAHLPPEGKAMGSAAWRGNGGWFSTIVGEMVDKKQAKPLYAPKKRKKASQSFPVRRRENKIESIFSTDMRRGKNTSQLPSVRAHGARARRKLPSPKSWSPAQRVQDFRPPKCKTPDAFGIRGFARRGVHPRIFGAQRSGSKN